MSNDGNGMIKILYNNCYGGFNFSDEFVAEYKRRKGEDIGARGRLYYNGLDSMRCDPVVVAIFEEFGSERSSGPTAALELYEIPAIFARYWEIDEYDGDETVRVNINDAYADVLHAYMGSGDHVALERQYRAITSAAARWRRGPPRGPGPEIVAAAAAVAVGGAPAAPVLKPSTVSDADNGGCGGDCCCDDSDEE